MSGSGDGVAAKYMQQMMGLDFGYGLRTPHPFKYLQPGICGYLDSQMDWHKMVDLTDKEDLEQKGLKPFNDKLEIIDSSDTWRPHCSRTVSVKNVDFTATLNAQSLGLPAHVKGALKYTSGTNFGAVVMSDSPVVREYYEHPSRFSAWLQDNDQRLMELFPDVEKFGLDLVTKTFSTGDAYIAIWDNKKHEVYVGLGAGAGEQAQGEGSASYSRVTDSTSWRSFVEGVSIRNYALPLGLPAQHSNSY
jgi:hypothetical protein